MPPKASSKRAASSSAGASQPKRAKTSSSAAKSERWSKVSNSRNADADFNLAVRDPAKANAYIGLCKPRFVDSGDSEDDDDEDDWDDDDEEDEGDESSQGADAGNARSKTKSQPGEGKVKCDGGRKCLCQKPAGEHPEHDFVLTNGGFRKWICTRSMAFVRCPDFFDLHTYNDHEAYGMIEIIQNLILDWTEASTWQEQWVVCEGLVMFMLDEGVKFYTIDDGSQADVVAMLIGRLFLTMLARLEAKNLLTDGSEVRSLGLIMTLYIKLASVLRASDVLEDGEEDDEEGFGWRPSGYDDYVNAYASKYGITLHGVSNVDSLTAGLDTGVELPTGEAAWGWERALKSYVKRYATSPPGRGKPGKIGGDRLDITSWSSAERREHSFDGKDPLKKADLDALKKGMVMDLA